MKFYDFIEIGTSDFHTEVEKNDDKIGVSIEPIKYYLDKLPCKQGCLKLNMGISDYNGTCIINFLKENTIQEYDFPYWAKGCSSINSIHPRIEELCNRANVDIDSVLEKHEVLVTTLYQIMNTLCISGVYYLKIDTEGHDTAILKHFCEESKNNKMFLPHVIHFESNELTNESKVTEIVDLLTKKGYDLIVRGYDTTLKLNLQNVENKTKFSTEIKKYFIRDYPPNYSIHDLPHANTLDSAKEYCFQHGYTGITLQDGIYQVRIGKYLEYFNGDITSWIFV